MLVEMLTAIIFVLTAEVVMYFKSISNTYTVPTPRQNNYKLAGGTSLMLVVSL